MTAKYYAILTNQGAAKLVAATALGTQIHITQMAVGDGNGSLPTPDATQTQLLNQKRIGAVNTLTVDATNANQIIAEQVIPENEGGYWIREMGLFDDDGVLIAIANCPETYKPLLQEGSGRTQTIRMALIVSSTAAVTLKIDPSVVLATRKYVDDKVIEVKAYSDELMKQHLSSANPHDQYLMIGNALKELQSAGLVDEALSNLGLKESARRDVGTSANQIPDMSSFSTGNTNSFRLPTGHIVQFGSGKTISGGFTQSYPVPFPTLCQCLMGVVYSTLGVRTFVATNASDRTAANMNVVDINGNGINVTVGYIAIGY
ncbi:phage tail protein [Kosakonia sacchari]|uniref:phage tail protein n=1 Tax=Kosakonia sacchari TaxID=1158459 RepID=UPI0025AF5B05|nr:phage tail protein [Kosakonia sacchari]MDN2488520.1 phage tail protein [Kosakonia sacchari]